MVDVIEAPSSNTIQFVETKSPRPIYGLAIVWDLANFTAFYNQPDAPQHIGRYLNRIRSEITAIFEGGSPDWFHPSEKSPKASPLSLKLLQRKFLGDGELLILELPEKRSDAAKSLLPLFYRLLLMNVRFAEITNRIDEEFQITNFPDKIRFGAAPGLLFELPLSSGQSEYVGSCINLASRLTKYSRELSFVASATLEVDIIDSMKTALQRYIAIDVRAFPPQKVICFKNEVDALDKEVRARLFKTKPTT